jgi:hypothetical protein
MTNECVQAFGAVTVVVALLLMAVGRLFYRLGFTEGELAALRRPRP